MAGNSDDMSNTSKPAKGTTEKKKRKRPSKKVPTTVLQANSSGFMHLVQKLTGSAEELAAGESSNPSPYQSPYSSPSNQPETTTYQSTATHNVDTSHGFNYSSAPYSGPYSNAAAGYMPSFQDQYQQYPEPATSNYGYSGYGTGAFGGGGSRGYGDDEDSSYGYRGSGDQASDRYNNSSNNNNNSSPSSSRGMDQHDASPFSWRDNVNRHNSSSDYYCFLN